jgi:hypothetical protein
MSSYRKDGSVVLPSDPDAGNYNPVTHDKPAPGGSTDHTSPGVGSYIRNAIMGATGMDKVSKALGK